MQIVPLASLIFHPRKVREVVSEHTKGASIVVNALNGMLVVAAMCIPMLSLFTFPLLVLLTVLFGPFLGFAISSIYSRVEWRVGKTLGSKASREDLYSLFTWSFLPAALGVLFYSLILLSLKAPSPSTQFLASIPSLLILCCAIRNYCSNVILTHRFSGTRGILTIVLTLILFLILITGGFVLLMLLNGHGTEESLKSLFAQQ